MKNATYTCKMNCFNTNRPIVYFISAEFSPTWDSCTSEFAENSIMWEARRAKSFKLVTFMNIRIVSTGSYSCTSRCVLHTKYLKRVPIRQFHFVGPSPMNYSSSQRSILMSLRVHRIVCVCSGSYTRPARRVYFGSLSSDLQCIFIFVLVDRISKVIYEK